MSPVKTRFAPSPTGFLHLGGARTALFNWLFARQQMGSFLLRIEDTDVERSTEEAVKGILEGLSWLGLNWDEGPYFQSQRLKLYLHHAERLQSKGAAYRCYCPADLLEAKRKAALKAGTKPRYDGTCRPLIGSERPGPAAVRFLAQEAGQTVVDDLIKGTVIFDNRELDDLIIVRSDGSPTYNFCVVVDDATMGITHVIRGDDHLNNTPRQIQLYQALGYPTPRFAHLPLILGEDKSRLSKRFGATSVTAYRELGYLPEAMVNFLARLGWAYGDQEVFSREELIEKFRLEQVGKSSGVFNLQKLTWLNGYYLRKRDSASLARELIPFLEAKGLPAERGEWLYRVVETLKERCHTLSEMVQMGAFYFTELVEYEPAAAERHLRPELLEPFQKLVKRLGRLPLFLKDEVESVLRSVADESGIVFKELAQAIRVALTGGTVSPPLFDLMEVLEKRKTILRLNHAIAYIQKRGSG